MRETSYGDYVLGLAGLALLREWYTDEAEPRRQQLLTLAEAYETDHTMQFSFGTPEREMTDGYTSWAKTYDVPDNPMTAVEESIVTPWFSDHLFPGARALDVGCGTGRHCASLAELGFDVIGVDLTPAMLDVARDKVPAAEFRQGAFDALPVEDDSVDVLVSALAVCHAPELDAVFSEFARVLKPGAPLIVSDPHPSAGHYGGQAFFRDDSAPGALPFVRNRAHPLSDYARALLANGFRIDGLHEIPADRAVLELNPTFAAFPELIMQALLELPFVVIWQATLTNASASMS